MSRPRGSKDTKKRKHRIPEKALTHVGKKYGRLLIVSLNKNWLDYDTHKKTMFDVHCDCGKKLVRDIYDILYRKVVSCGCYQKEQLIKRQTKPDNFAAKRNLYEAYENGAKARNLCFELSFDEVYNLSQKNCYYCNKKPSNLYKTAGGQILANGIDRVNNKIGYKLNNCVPCCRSCNITKKAVTIDIAKKILEFINATS